jgi:UDP:flavonoid glycosyltransferase YjiC (YdhE family)
MNILVFPVGSAGDVHPLVGLALALQARGHTVTCLVHGYFRELVERVGLRYVEQGTAEEFLQVTEHPDLWHPLRSFGYVFRRGIVPALRHQFAAVAERHEPGRTLLIHSCLGFGVRIAQEKLGVPTVTVHCQPVVLWSEYASPTLPGMLFPGGPRWLRRWQFWIGERFFIDRTACPETNRFRAELGLPPMSRTAHWWHSPDGVLCLFPEWFGPRQPDWPPQVRLSQFPLWDEGTVHPPQPEVEQFLTAAEPPLVFTPGTANRHAATFFAAAVAACRQLGRRGLLLTRFPEQIPTDLPPTVRHFAYVPFSQVLPRTAALVHHGGIGTTAQGLRAGIPQLIMPLAHDQPDNAARVKRLGVGDWLRPSAFRGPAVARMLQRLLAAAEVRRHCAEVAARFVGVQPFAEACAVVEYFAAQRGVADSQGKPTEPSA